MKIELLTEFVDNTIAALKKEFGIKEELKNSFYLNPFLRFLLLYDKDKIIGYLRFDVLYDKVELTYIYINEKYRNKGCASLLMKTLITFCKKRKIENITLEVNKLNSNAIALYKKFDFVEIAIRKAYYHGIDGILMERKMM